MDDFETGDEQKQRAALETLLDKMGSRFTTEQMRDEAKRCGMIPKHVADDAGNQAEILYVRRFLQRTHRTRQEVFNLRIPNATTGKLENYWAHPAKMTIVEYQMLIDTWHNRRGVCDAEIARIAGLARQHHGQEAQLKLTGVDWDDVPDEVAA